MKKSLKIFFLVVVIGSFMSSNLKAQDQQFTQFYASPILLNPAMAGTSVQSRVAMSYRNQWAALPKAFVSYNVSYDQFISQVKSGIGVTVRHDRAGTGGLSYTAASLQYAYEINITRKISIRPALSVGFGSTYLDVDRLTFSDQLAREDDGASTLDPDRARFVQKPVNYPDFGAGVVLYSEKFWVGGAVKHINEPVQSVTGGETTLPKKVNVHGGLRLKLNDLSAFSGRQYIVPAFNYQSQGSFDQLDLGFYYEYAPMTIGLWYRGLPLLKSNEYDYLNHDALAVLIGYEINNMKIGYSYDLTISKLGANSAGSHEISWVMEWASKRNKKRNKRRVMPCAKF